MRGVFWSPGTVTLRLAPPLVRWMPFFIFQYFMTLMLQTDQEKKKIAAVATSFDFIFREEIRQIFLHVLFHWVRLQALTLISQRSL